MKADPAGSTYETIVKADLTKLSMLEKDYRKVTGEFTVKSGQENPLLVFNSYSHSGIIIDSFKLEKIK